MMKKYLLLLTMALLPIVASAGSVFINGIYYNLIPKGKVAEVTSCSNKYYGEVVIPASVIYEEVEYSVKSIGINAFYSCSGLTSITIPNSVTNIGERAFYYCSGLTSITIPNSVTNIGQEAFCYCSGLTSITIPNSVTNIGKMAFNGYSMTSIVVERGNTSYDSRNNCNAIIETASNRLITGCNNSIIPSSVISIGELAFFSCYSLTSVTIPNSVTSIDQSAFSYCSGLTSITIPNSVKSIGNFAFESCSGLKTITIGDGIRTIGRKAFADCPELTDVHCYAETVPIMVDLYNRVPYTDAFWGSYPEYATLHVPSASVNAYKAAEPWKNFKSIVSLDDGDTPEPPDTQKCATPTISYTNGKLTFNCETEGAECQYAISDNDIKSGAGNEVQLEVTYTVNVYATKVGYENSEMATATLCWIDQQPQTEDITNGMANVPALAVLIQSDGGILTVQGVDDGTQVSVYGIDGIQAGSAISQNGIAHITTSLQSGSIAIVKVGEKSVKVMVK